MPNEWNANTRIWETPPSLNTAESSSSDNCYGAASSQYYNAPTHQQYNKEQVYQDSSDVGIQQHYDRAQVCQSSPQMETQQPYKREQVYRDLSNVGTQQHYKGVQVYESSSQMGTQQQYERAQMFQNTSQISTGYLYNPSSQASTRGLQQDKSLVLKAVDSLNQIGGLDIDPVLISELSKHIKNDDASDQPSRPEIYSPTFNSPTPSPDRKQLSEGFEVDGKKLVSSKPFYEQFNHYEDDTYKTSKTDQFFSITGRNRRSRSSEKRTRSPNERTWAGSPSPSPPLRHNKAKYDHSDSDSSHAYRRSRSPQSSRNNRYEGRSNRRYARSRSPVSRTRSISRESSRNSRIMDSDIIEKVNNLLGMSKVENRKFVDAQQSSNVLLVMNLQCWITDKVLWGAIHKYAREYGTKPPFYIEKASFKLSKDFNETHLALIAFHTNTAAEMCMMHTKCELEVTGRTKSMFKMMYYNENTILFDALNHRFTGIWRAVLKLRAKQREDSRDSPEKNERRRTRERRSRSSHRTESETHNVDTKSERKTKKIDDEMTVDHDDKIKTPVLVKNENSDLSEAKTLPTEENVSEQIKLDIPEPDKVESKKPQPNIIKTNVLIGKMKSYLIKQNKSKPEINENDTLVKELVSNNTLLDQKKSSGQNKSDIHVKEVKSKALASGSGSQNKSVLGPKIQTELDHSGSKSSNVTCSDKSIDKRKETKIQPKDEVLNAKNIKKNSCVKTSDKKVDDHNIQPEIQYSTPSSMNRKNSDETIHKSNKESKNQSKIDCPMSGTNKKTSSPKLTDERKDDSTINVPLAKNNTTKDLLKESKTPLSKEIKNETITSSDNVTREKLDTKIEISPKGNSVATSGIKASIPKEIKEKQSEDIKQIDKKSDEPMLKKNKNSNVSKDQVSKEIKEKESENVKEINKKPLEPKKNSTVPSGKKGPISKEIKEKKSGDVKQIHKKSDEPMLKKNNSNVSEDQESPVEKKPTIIEPSIIQDTKIIDIVDVSKNESDLKIKNSNTEVGTLSVPTKNPIKPDKCKETVTTETDVTTSNEKSESIKNKQKSKNQQKNSQKTSSEEKDFGKTKDEKYKEKITKIVSKRKVSPAEEPQNVKVNKEDTDESIEDPESVREREEEEAELFGKGLDKYRPKNDRFKRRRSPSRELNEKNNRVGRNFDRRDDSPFRNSREDRFGKRGGYRNDNNRRSNWEHPGHHDKRRREDDDIDGNEDGYWSKNRESSKRTTSVNPWMHQENLENKVSLSIKELKDPEFLLRVLLQTSILIQNNQLTMSNPLDSLTPTDKDLIIQTLSEIEATSQVLIYATLNDKSKFNAAEHRVLLEALSNIHMFKAALLPPGGLIVNNEVNINKNEKLNAGTSTENKTEEADVYVSMTYIKHWVTKQHIIKYLRNYNLIFDFVKIHPLIKGEPHTTGFIKFKDVDSASELLRRTNRVLYIGNDKDGIQLSISEVTKKVSKWSCNSCSMRNPYDTLICFKCQKLKEKLRDINVTTDVTNTLALINFKITTPVDEIKRIMNKIAPFLKTNVVSHVDSLSNEVIHFLVDLPNSQACSMLKKCIRDNLEEFSHFQAGPRVAISFVLPKNPKARVYTYEDVPRLAQYSASLYATTEEEKIKYYQHYTALYTQELVLGNPINVILPEDALNNTPGQSFGVPNGTDNRQWPIPNVSSFTYDPNSRYYYDHSTGLYYESSSQYFYNMETGKFLQYDTARNTYVLAQCSEISSAPVKALSESQGNVPLGQVSGTVEDNQSAVKSNTSTKESKIHAKKVMKDLVKWSKTVNKQDKKKAASNVFTENMDTMEKPCPADVGFDILQKTETSKPNLANVPRISSLIMEHTVCADEEEEYSFIDWKNFTCNLCHRVFSNAEILNKHSKLSELHRNNLQQWYISKNLDPDNEEIRKQQYRDRAAERRSKMGGRSESQTQEPAESWLCNTPGCMSYKKSGFNLCFSCERSAPHGAADMSVGSQLLKKMGWEQGGGQGIMDQGNRKNDKQSDYLGLGAQNEEKNQDSESYTNFMKKNTQKRFKEVSGRF